MKGNLHLLLLLVFGTISLQAQTFREISTGSQYNDQVYFQLSDFTPTAVANDSWDLAFTAFGVQDAGIHVNESARLDNNPPPVQLFFAPSNNFDDIFQESELTDRLVNSEESWSWGAGNHGRDLANFADYGWGMYNPAINQVIGNKVYVMAMRDGSYKKFIIDSLVATTYYLRHADLDGNNEMSATINKADHSEAGMAYFSFSTNSTINTIPAKWDLFFGRYRALLPDGTPYDVTGILSHPTLEVAEINDLPAEEVDQNTSLTFEDRIDVIGSDWKGFSFTSGWILADSLSYVVKMPNNQLYKLVFIDFEGSGTGTATFEQSDLGILSSNRDLGPQGASWSVFPNPISDGRFTLSLDLDQQLNNAEVSLFNTLGQQLWQRQLATQVGLNAYELELPNALPAGQYWIRLQAASGQLVKSVYIK
ncbi:MAG: T9SS type A sorting domain-containing protein [Saprospiraceae bacterium]|nr:T9SS type A sorting domain-containing protein [Saprospiraceae bacterium]